MKFISGLIGLILAVLALCFAFANKQDTTISVWPLGFEVQAPLYLLTLGTLLLGILLGAIIGWFAMLGHRFEARRLRKDIAKLHEKINDLQQTVLPPLREDFVLPKPKKPFWKLRA